EQLVVGGHPVQCDAARDVGLVQLPGIQSGLGRFGIEREAAAAARLCAAAAASEAQRVDDRREAESGRAVGAVDRAALELAHFGGIAQAEVQLERIGQMQAAVEEQRPGVRNLLAVGVDAVRQQ